MITTQPSVKFVCAFRLCIYTKTRITFVLASPLAYGVLHSVVAVWLPAAQKGGIRTEGAITVTLLLTFVATRFRT
jgi:hypothetical protein